MTVLCIAILLAVLVAAACTLTGESGKAIRRGDEMADKYYREKERDHFD